MPGVWIIEAQQQIEDCRLAGAGRTDDGDRLARRDAAVEAVQGAGVGPRRVGEAQTLELDRAARGLGHGARAIGGDDDRRRVQDFSQPLGGARRLLHLAPHLGKLCERAGGEHRIKHELGQPPAGHGPRQDVAGAEPEDADDAREDEQDDERGQTRACAHAAQGSLERAHHGKAIAPAHLALVRIGLHGAHAAQIVGGIGGGVGERILRARRQPAHRSAVGHQRQHDQGDSDKDEARELGAGDHHHDERAEQHHQVADRLRDGRARRRLDLGRIGGEAGHQLASLCLLEKGGRQPGEMREHVASQVGDDPLADPVDGVEAQRAGSGEHDADDHHHAEVAVDELSVGAREARVDHAANAERHDEHSAGRYDDRRQHAGKRAWVSQQIRLQRGERRQRLPPFRSRGVVWRSLGAGVFPVGFGHVQAQFYPVRHCGEKGRVAGPLTRLVRPIPVRYRGPFGSHSTR